jgi:hypothetical protein
LVLLVQLGVTVEAVQVVKVLLLAPLEIPDLQTLVVVVVE